MARYTNIPTEKIKQKQAYINVRYPQVPLADTDTYVYTTDGDRFDTLAAAYYKDPSLWWIISIANQDLPQNSIIPPAGTQIRIPANAQSILVQFELLNS